MTQIKVTVEPVKCFVDGSFRVSFNVDKSYLEQIFEIMKLQFQGVILQVTPESEALKMVEESGNSLRQTIYKKIMNCGLTDRRRELYVAKYSKERLSDFNYQELDTFNCWLGEHKNWLNLREQILKVIGGE